MSSSILVVGSMAFDSIETPFGTEAKILGGSANYFSLSASYFSKVRCVSVVGKDFPQDHLKVLESRGVDTRGIQVEQGDTFHWKGRYGYDLNEAQTLATFLNVFERFEPTVPADYTESDFVFLGNIAPALQMKVLSQVKSPKFIALDTMNFWIEGQRDTLVQAIGKVDCVIINEGEARQLTKTHNVTLAAQTIKEWGPKIVVVKRGEYGAILFAHDQMFGLPAMPMAEVKDPTGAGDSFAGGFMGYLASKGESNPSIKTLRKAVVYGSAMASFTVQDFGFRALLKTNTSLIEDRYQRFVDLTTFHI